MPLPQETLLKIIHDTKAVSIWNRRTGPVFWYAAGVPGPFYVNTELVIGPQLAKDLLERITSTIASSNDPATRVAALKTLMMDAYEKNPSYKLVIQAMVDCARSEFPQGSFDVISGGERRDWLFSIPFAHAINARHLYLFKNQTCYCPEGIKSGERALHVADLINNAASYFDLWLPTLQKAKMSCAGTLAINSRGTNGVDRLREAKIKTVPLNSIDLGFFKKWHESGLINQETYDELALFFASTKDWGAQYLTTDVSLFELEKLDKKSFERLQSFFNQDPWGLRVRNEAFFVAMKQAIAQRKAAA